jgi:hypothetical protein
VPAQELDERAVCKQYQKNRSRVMWKHKHLKQDYPSEADPQPSKRTIGPEELGKKSIQDSSLIFVRVVQLVIG